MKTTLLYSLMLAAMLPAKATEFQIESIALPGGISIFGTLTTDGTIGPLTAANFTAWNVTVRQTTVYRFDPTNPGGAQASAVNISADGRRMTVKASPDGVRDGGILAFGSFGPGPEYGVQVANFTGYYAGNGGMAFYLAGPAFEWAWFNAPNGSTRLVAKAPPGSSVFTLVPVVFASGATLTGRITTDGSVGPIGPAQLLDWRIAATSVSDTVYLKTADGSNSSVLPASNGFSTDGVTLSVARPGGYLGFGVPPAPPRRGAGAVLADFSGTAPRKGQAGYFDAFGLQYKPLHFGGTMYPVAHALP